MKSRSAFRRALPMVAGCVLATLLAPLAPGACGEDLEVQVNRLRLDLEAKRRRDAADELQRVREEKEQLERRIAAARDWALHQFELADRGIVERPRKMTRLLTQLEDAKKSARYKLLTFPDQARSAIHSGAALNVLLDECAGPAFDYEAFCKLAKKEDRELLRGVVATYELEAEILRHVRYRRGLSGGPLVGRLNHEALDLASWPSALRAAHYDELRAAVEDARARAIADLKKGRPISNDAANALKTSVGDLLAAFVADMNQYVRLHGYDGHSQRLFEARRFAKGLVASVYRLVEARKLEDVTIPAFKGGTVGQLMAYMHENNLRFERPDANGETAYHLIFQMMARYFVDLQSFKIVDDRIQELQDQEQGLREISLGEKFSNDQLTDMFLKACDVTIKRMEAEKGQ